ncbi:hypothetical protein [Methylobacterium bullatum]|uniref:hypothetical protein n=1 Tax=Methylobacterium bullatum TaxID=570505 RepID=UPI00177DEE0D|nr:hypothetical protein [Methylobacterium bullatum]
MSALTASENPKTIFHTPARQFKLLARFVRKPGLRITQLREVTVLTTSAISELHFSQAGPPVQTACSSHTESGNVECRDLAGAIVLTAREKLEIHFSQTGRSVRTDRWGQSAVLVSHERAFQNRAPFFQSRTSEPAPKAKLARPTLPAAQT